MKDLYIEDKKFNWPEGWADFDHKVKIQIAKFSTGLLSFHGAEKLIIYREIIRIILENAWQKDYGKFRKWWNGLKISIEQFESLKADLEWVAEKPTERPFEHFEHKGVKYYILPERFENVSCAEWVESIIDFMELSSGEAVENTVMLLISNFSRPERADLKEFKASESWNGDVREVYNRQKAIERAAVLSDLDPGIVIQLLWWYESQISQFFEEFSDLFTGGNGSPRYSDGRGYLMLLKNVAKAGYVGNFDQVCNAPVLNVFGMLLDEKYDSDELNKKLKRNESSY